jgi:hypothetical protein
MNNKCSNNTLSNAVILLFLVFGIIIVVSMSYVDNAAQTTSTKRGLVTGPLPDGDMASMDKPL